jgi:hypothetical protein
MQYHITCIPERVLEQSANQYDQQGIHDAGTLFPRDIHKSSHQLSNFAADFTLWNEVLRSRKMHNIYALLIGSKFLSYRQELFLVQPS